MNTSVYRSQIKFAWSGRRNHIVGWLLIPLLAVLFLVADFKLNSIVNFWADNVDPYFSIAVLIVALTLWFGEFHQDWRQSLPCLLTVVFVFKDREVMRCENAALASEADMRALGQTIGSQMIDNKTLTFFAPKVKQSGGDVVEIKRYRFT